MIDSTQWRLKNTHFYGIGGERSPLVLCRFLKSPLIRIDLDFKTNQSQLKRAGTIQQTFNGIKSGEQPVPFESRYYVFPSELVPYGLQWNPAQSLPQGYIQVWEYYGLLSNSALNQLISFSNGDSMPLSNPVIVNLPTTSGTTPTATTVASAATSTTLLAANSSRKDAKIFNSSTARLYVAFGPAASLTAFAFMLEAGGFYEFAIPYTGVISGIWSAVNGNALITEIV